MKTYASHFCGCGGACYGLERAGMECRLAIDSWQPAVTYRERNVGHKALCMDIAEYEPCESHAADLLWTSPPCQTFSSCARESSMMKPDDIRNFLFLASIKYCRTFKPRYFVLENVMGLMTHEADQIGDSTLTQMRRAFMALGYHVEWNVLNSSHWLPQDRERIFVVGSLDGKTGLIPRPPDARHEFGEIMERNSIGTAWGSTTYSTAFSKVYRRKAKMRIVRAEDMLPTITCAWGGGGTRKKVAILDETNEGVAFLRHATIREGARAQGFPDTWEWPSWSQAWQLIGNAVSSPVAEAIARHLMALDAGERPPYKRDLDAKRIARYAREMLDALPPTIRF